MSASEDFQPPKPIHLFVRDGNSRTIYDFTYPVVCFADNEKRAFGINKLTPFITMGDISSILFSSYSRDEYRSLDPSVFFEIFKPEYGDVSLFFGRLDLFICRPSKFSVQQSRIRGNDRLLIKALERFDDGLVRHSSKRQWGKSLSLSHNTAPENIRRLRP